MGLALVEKFWVSHLSDDELLISQKAIYDKVINRRAMRYLIASFVAGVLLCSLFIGPVLGVVFYAPNTTLVSIWKLIMLVGFFIIPSFTFKVLDKDHSFYYPRFAKFVFGKYRAEQDLLGGCIDLNYVLSDRVIEIATRAKIALNKGHQLFFNNEQITDIIALTVKNAATPYRGGVYVRTTTSTWMLGPQYFLECYTQIGIWEHKASNRWIYYGTLGAWIQDNDLLIGLHFNETIERSYFGKDLSEKYL